MYLQRWPTALADNPDVADGERDDAPEHRQPYQHYAPYATTQNGIDFGFVILVWHRQFHVIDITYHIVTTNC